MSDDSKQKIRRFLRKQTDEPVIKKAGETPQETREFIQKNLLTRPSDFYENQRGFYERLVGRFKRLPLGIMFWKQSRFKAFMTETFPLLAFISFSCLILWKMENQFDEMHQTMNKRKSLKQVEMERENEEIQRALFDEKFDSVPIRDKPKKQIYKFEGFDEDEREDNNESFAEEDAHLSTRQGFVEAIYEEYLKGQPVPQEFRREVAEYIELVKQREEKRRRGLPVDDGEEEDEEEEFLERFTEEDKN